jgi:hypothetical protein
MTDSPKDAGAFICCESLKSYHNSEYKFGMCLGKFNEFTAGVN